MNVLFVSLTNFFSTYGGGQIYLKNIIDEMINKGVFPVIVMPSISTEIKQETYNLCPIEVFNPNSNENEIKKILIKYKPGIVHIHGYKAVFAKACKDLNIPCIITAHHGGIVCPAGALLNYKDEICTIKADSNSCLPCVLKSIRGGFYSYSILRYVPYKKRLRIGQQINKLPFILYFSPVLKAQLSIETKFKEWEIIHQNATKIIAPSHAIEKAMVLNGCSASKITVLPHGIPIDDKHYVTNKLNKADEPVKFYYVGRICYVKGVHVMLAAFEKLNIYAELHIIGGAGNKNEIRYMNQLIRKYSKNKNITWHGKISSIEINQIIINYDVLIHPTICLEIFGLNIAESLALGKPVIATRCGGAEMQIEDGVNGWLISPNDVSQLKLTIEKVVNQINVIRKFRIENPVSIEQHVSILIDTYEETII